MMAFLKSIYAQIQLSKISCTDSCLGENVCQSLNITFIICLRGKKECLDRSTSIFLPFLRLKTASNTAIYLIFDIKYTGKQVLLNIKAIIWCNSYVGFWSCL